MSSGREWRLEDVQPRAIELFHLLRPYCHQIKIAGSIRRQKEIVHDIEIVCVPIIKTVTVPGILGDQEIEIQNLEFAQALSDIGELVKGSLLKGRYTQLLMRLGGDKIKVDVFRTNVEDFGRQLAIRTGPANYSKDVIATGWVKKGWVGTEFGLRKKTACIKNKQGQWIPRADPDHSQKPPPFHNEKDFFSFIGVNWPEPSERK